MYHVWNQDAGKFVPFDVLITRPFELVGYIVVICSPKNVYVCHKDHIETCVKAVSSLMDDVDMKKLL